MGIQLLDLPQACLEEIIKKLPFAEISRLGAICKQFREIAKTIFRLYFRNIEETVEMEMEKIETEANTQDSLTISEHLYLALLHSVLRILLSEAKMLKAHCWRYMREPNYDFCFPAGLILDEIERILRSVRNKTLKKDMEPEITTTLFHLGETFYDYFDFHIENRFPVPSGLDVKITSRTNRQTFSQNFCNFVPSLRSETPLKNIHGNAQSSRVNDVTASSMDGRPPLGKSGPSEAQKMPDQEPSVNLITEGGGVDLISFVLYSEVSLGQNVTHQLWLIQISGTYEKTLFGVKILDILNCCALSNFHTLLSHSSNKEGFKLQTHYELRDINVLEALPTIGLSMATSEKQLNKICRYIRNNVRWTNLFHQLQDLWMLEDAIEINRNVETASALLRQWKLQRMSSRFNLNNTENHIFQYDHRKIISRFKNHFGLLITANLECPTLQNVPLKIDKCLGSKCLVLDNNTDLPDCNLGCHISSDELSNKNRIHQTHVEKWDCNITTYKFNLELKIQYPSFLSETIREAILKVDQIGEKTMVTTDGDDMRKSATYRADENEE